MNLFKVAMPVIASMIPKDNKAQNVTINNYFGSGQPPKTGEKPMLKAAADALGLSTEELSKRLQTGKSLDQVSKDVAPERNLDPNAVLEKVHAALASALKAMRPGLSEA